jgi:transketolase N-terminal domain/subunit
MSLFKEAADAADRAHRALEALWSTDTTRSAPTERDREAIVRFIETAAAVLYEACDRAGVDVIDVFGGELERGDAWEAISAAVDDASDELVAARAADRSAREGLATHEAIAAGGAA